MLSGRLPRGCVDRLRSCDAGTVEHKAQVESFSLLLLPSFFFLLTFFRRQREREEKKEGVGVGENDRSCMCGCVVLWR